VTQLESNGQWIDVNVSDNYFDPNIIVAKAGVPITINFGEGQGCMAEVMFEDFPVNEDLTTGGAVVELPALDPGEYGFTCGMQMVAGTLVVLE
jgi:Cu+-exporting ATPase